MKHNEDDALYQQILAELKPGADEYDRMVAQKKHPAGLRRRFRPRFGYVAAACVMIAFLVATQILWQTDGLQQPPQLARQVLPTAGDVATRVAVPKDAPSEIPVKQQRCQQRLVAATMATPKTEEEVKDSASVKLAPPTDHAETDRAAIVAGVSAPRPVTTTLFNSIYIKCVCFAGVCCWAVGPSVSCFLLRWFNQKCLLGMYRPLSPA